ncbi:unnamed protein product [Mucor fragilis]
MDKNAIAIDDSDSELPDVLPHHQPYPSTAGSSRTGVIRSQVPQSRSSLSAFEQKRRGHDSNIHPLARNSSRALPKSSSQSDAHDGS